jgi:hypothetical protein
MGWVVSTDKKGKTGQSTMRYYLNPAVKEFRKKDGGSK